MRLRGRELFDGYVSTQLNDPTLAGLPIGTHVFNLVSAAAEAHIPMLEVIDEVGPIVPALTAARRARV